MRNLRALDLANEIITVADSSVLDVGTGDFSIVAWVKFDTLGATVIFQKGTSAPYIKLELVSSTGYKVRYTQNDDTLSDVITGSTALSAGTWYLIVVSADRSGNVSLYLNGASNATPVSSDAVLTLNSTEDLDLTDSNFDGMLGEVQLVKGYALTSAEALNLYTRGISKGLKASYGGGDVTFWARWKNRVFKDNSGYGNEMTGANVSRVDRKRIQSYR